MNPELPLALVVLAVVVLVAGGGGWLWRRRRLRRQQRQHSWRELCLRLELVPQPGEVPVARGDLSGTDFLLHDTGSHWLVELPLAQPVLPPGMVLVSPEAPSLPPRLRMPEREWQATALPPGLPAWSVGEEDPVGKVEAPEPFLEQAARAMQAHAPLRVEPQRFIQALRVGDLLPVNDAREAVRALETTARGWLEVVERHGLPQVLPPPPPPPPPPLPEPQKEQAPEPEPQAPPRQEEQAPEPKPELKPLPRLWVSLLMLNGGIPNVVLWLLMGCGGVLLLIIMMISIIWVGWACYEERYGSREVVMWLMMVSTNIVAPMLWILGSDTMLTALGLLLWGVPNVLWLGALARQRARLAKVKVEVKAKKGGRRLRQGRRR
jgi:hypothetical protein